jgi:putative glutamine amidotransferase
MTATGVKPLIGVTACYDKLEEHAQHRCTEKYLSCIPETFGGNPVVIPVLGDLLDLRALVRGLDGVLLTGGASNVEPHHYEGAPSVEGTLHDAARDETSLALIIACLEEAVPVFGICRGLQEINVALGGTLHQRIFDMPDKFDHRMRRDVSMDEKHRPAHPIRIEPGSVLHGIVGADEIIVNSLHAQGIDRPGERVQIEAWAPDGIPEAISIKDAPAFAVAVQWHPEWPRPIAGANRLIFEAFGTACQARAMARSGFASMAAE